MYEYTSDASVTKYLEWSQHTEIDQTRLFVTKTLKEYDNEKHAFLWGIELVSEAKLIGVIRIYDYSPQNKRAEISYILNPNFQGKGYIGEAIDSVLSYCFNTNNLGRVQAKCFANNTASEKVMKKAGMQYEGTLRNYYFFDDQFIDASLYAITGDIHKSKNIIK
jgi:ribosomal-protein-alanine N-acetyltransferase